MKSSRRWNDACFIQAGASSPGAVADSLITAIQDVERGGSDPFTDPAARLIAFQLDFLMKGDQLRSPAVLERFMDAAMNAPDAQATESRASAWRDIAALSADGDVDSRHYLVALMRRLRGVYSEVGAGSSAAAFADPAARILSVMATQGFRLEEISADLNVYSQIRHQVESMADFQAVQVTSPHSPMLDSAARLDMQRAVTGSADISADGDGPRAP